MIGLSDATRLLDNPLHNIHYLRVKNLCYQNYIVVLLALTIIFVQVDMTSRSPFPCAISIDSKSIASVPWNELLRS